MPKKLGEVLADMVLNGDIGAAKWPPGMYVDRDCNDTAHAIASTRNDIAASILRLTDGVGEGGRWSEHDESVAPLLRQVVGDAGPPSLPVAPFTAVLAVAGQAMVNGDIYTEEALRKAADNKTTFYEDGKLIHRSKPHGAGLVLGTEAADKFRSPRDFEDATEAEDNTGDRQ